MAYKISSARYGWLVKMEDKDGEQMPKWTIHPCNAGEFPDWRAAQIHEALCDKGIAHDLVSASPSWADSIPEPRIRRKET